MTSDRTPDDACPYEWAEPNLVPELLVVPPRLSPFAIRYFRARHSLIEAVRVAEPGRLGPALAGLRLVTGTGFFRR